MILKGTSGVRSLLVASWALGLVAASHVQAGVFGDAKTFPECLEAYVIKNVQICGAYLSPADKRKINVLAETQTTIDNAGLGAAKSIEIDGLRWQLSLDHDKTESIRLDRFSPTCRKASQSGLTAVAIDALQELVKREPADAPCRAWFSTR